MKKIEGENQLSTWNGIGTKFIPAKPRDEEGKNPQVRFFVIAGMPILPLERRLIGERTTQTHYGIGNSSRTKTSYRMLGQSKLKLTEVLFIYLLYWVFGPVCILGPTFVLGWLFLYLMAPELLFGITIFLLPLISLFVFIWYYLKWEKGKYTGKN